MNPAPLKCPLAPHNARQVPGAGPTACRPKQGLYDPWFEHDACGVGFVVDIKGRKSHQILKQAIQVLTNLDHRGAAGSEANTGDGAGVLLQMPHAFLKEACKKARITLPAPGEYGSGLVFLPRDRDQAPAARGALRADRAVRGPDDPRLAHACRSTTPPSARPPRPASRSSARSSSAATRR